MSLISIITPSFNRAALISESIESVINQDYSEIEHIIVDGGSVDGTLDILKQYPHLRVISEPDRGLYDAINKGILTSTGTIIGLLNTDDYYEPNVFGKVVEIFKKYPETAAILGGATFFRDSCYGVREKFAIFPSYPPNKFLFEVTEGTVNPNAWFFRRSIFEHYGLFDINYRYNADRDFLIKLALDEIEYICVDVIIYHYRHHDDSLTFNTKNTAESDFKFEMRELCEKYLDHQNIPSRARYRFRHWHSQITTNQTLLALSRLRLLRAVNYAIHGFRYNLFWPVVFLPSINKSTCRTLYRGVKRLVNNLRKILV